MNRLILTLVFLTLLISGCSRNIGPFDADSNISRDEIMFAHNKERSMRNIASLKTDSVLEKNAQKWAEWMVQNQSLVHSHLNMSGTDFNIMGENIAMGYDDIESVMNGWMNSPGHRRNILNGKFTHAGYGYAKRSDGSPYWCAQFGGK